jgi:hypothetical protein
MNFKRILLFLPLLFVRNAQAHCPLCTIGAATAAGGAAYLGINNAIIGVFIGAFAVSMGFWISKLIKKRYIPFQSFLIILSSFLTTVIPLLPIVKSIYPVYISLAGSYGSLLNRTYIINLFLIGSLLGALIVSIAPWLSNRITTYRHGRILPYQGILLTLMLLLIVSVVIEVII